MGASWEPPEDLLGLPGGLLGASGAFLGVSWGSLGGLLGRLGGLSGRELERSVRVSRLGTLLEPSWGRLGGLLCRLGTLWGRFGALLEVSRAILGPSWGTLGTSWSVGKRTKRRRRNPSKTNGNQRYFALEAFLGVLLEASDGVLEASSAVWSLLGRLGQIVRRFGALLDLLGGLLGHSWRVLALFWAPGRPGGDAYLTPPLGPPPGGGGIKGKGLPFDSRTTLLRLSLAGRLEEKGAGKGDDGDAGKEDDGCDD